MNTQPTTSGNILDKLFSGELFKNIDTSALVKQFDHSAELRSGNLAANPVVAPQPLIGNVISTIPPEGIVITQPGDYTFSKSISWIPTSPCSAITIQAANVLLDLKGYTLMAFIVKKTDQQYHGISVIGVDSVTVQGGTIKGMSYYGINSSKASNLQVYNMTIGSISYAETVTAYLTPCGIFVDDTDGFILQNCIIEGITVTAPSCAGIQVVESRNGYVLDCTMRNFLNNDGGVQGLSYLKSWKLLTRGCVCENFQSHYEGKTITSGHTVIGYVPIFCILLEFDNCSATGMTGCCDDCHGMSVFIDAFIGVTNFRAKDVIDGVTLKNTGAKATGLEVYGYDIAITDCSVENITAIVPQDLQSAGFSAWGSAIEFKGCSATKVLVTDATGVPSTKFGYGTGFGWAPDPRSEFNGVPADNVLYTACTATNCQLGFDTWFHTNSTWQQISAPGCPLLILVEPKGTPRTLSMDKCSESPDGQYQQVTITNIAENNVYPGD